MKVKLKAVLKTSRNQFECFDESQIIFNSGNALCIKEIERNDSEFICLSKKTEKLYAFKPTPNYKSVFTAQKIGDQIQIACYSLRGERKSINLSEGNGFFSFENIIKIQLLVDEFDSSVVYGAAHGKGESSCVFLVDIGKMKILALGYLPYFEDIKVNIRDNMTLSICGQNGGSNFIKSLKYNAGQWQTDERIYRKINSGNVIKHELLMGGRVMLATQQQIYIFQDNQLLQTVSLAHQNSSIVHFVKIPKGLLVGLKNNKILVFIEDSDDVSLLPVGEMKVELESSNIFKITLSNNNEEVLLRTCKNELFIWKCEQLSLSSDSNRQFNFHRITGASSTENEGNLTISTGKKYCLFSGTKAVALWHIEKNECVLNSQFSVHEDSNKKSINCCAINPDGNSIIIAFQDRIRLYKILMTKFKFYAQFPIKRCHNVVFSHGGQLLACRYGKSINSSIVVINTLRLVEVMTIKVQAEPLQIVWNELDDEMLVSTDMNTVQCYRIADNTRVYSVKIPSPINHIRIDYSTKKMLASTDESIILIQGGQITEKIMSPINRFHYVYPLHGMYFAVSKEGVLYWSNSIKFESMNEMALFSNEPFNLLCRNGFLLAYNNFQNVLAVQCTRLNYVPKKNNINEEIALIEKEEIDSIFEKVKMLESNFQMYTMTSQIKRQEERKRYDDALLANTKKFQKEIQFCNKKFAEMTMEKIKQQKQTEKVFEQLENGQVKSVYQIQKMYDRKLKLQKEKLMSLEQQYLQQKQKYDKVILDLQEKNHIQIAKIREEYSRKLKEQCARVEKVKSNNLQYKKQVQMKLIDAEEQTEMTLFDLQKSKDDIIQNLNERIVELEEAYDRSQVNLHNKQTELSELKVEDENREKELRRIKSKLQQSESRVSMLEKQVQKKNIMLEDKNSVIQQQAHQIGGLEKAKYVLSFRTTQIRKQLEPKQNIIEKLRSELFKLDGEFKLEQKKNYESGQRIEKLTKINNIVKKQNQQYKIGLKNKERLHDQLCSEIFNIVNTMDQKQWVPAFLKIYQNYIKQDKFKSRQTKKKDDTTEEINRHLIHVEQSLIQVSTGNEKILKGKEKDVVRKMKENAELVYDLNVMRKKQNEYISQINEKASEIAKLKREINDSNKSSTRAQTAKTGLTRRVIASRDGISREKSNILDMNQLGSQLRRESEGRQRNKQRSRIASAHKTLMWREDKREKSSKLFDLARQLQAARQTIKKQDQMIEEFNQRMFGALDEPNMQ